MSKQREGMSWKTIDAAIVASGESLAASAQAPSETAGPRGSLDLAACSPAKLAADLANALWEVSVLRHGLFTPPQFREICERVIAARLKQENVKDEPRRGEY